MYPAHPGIPVPARTPQAVPLAARVIGAGLNLAERHASRLSGKLLWRLWFTPARVRPNERARALLATARESFDFRHGRHLVRVHGWGEGPLVILAHGWSGYGGQLGSLVSPLVDAGHRVWLFDAPGHADQPRTLFNLGEYRDLLRALVVHAGGARAIVGHSLGATAAALALEGLPSPVDLVAIAPTANLGTLVAGFRRKLALDEAAVARLGTRLEEYFGHDVWRRYSLDRVLPVLSGRVLLVHDGQDREADLGNSLWLRRHRPTAELMVTRDLGHNRILHDPAVVARITRFVARLPVVEADHSPEIA